MHLLGRLLPLLKVVSATAALGLQPAVPVDEPSLAPRQTRLRPAATPEASVAILYADAVFFGVRGNFDEARLDRLTPCFTAGLATHFKTRRANLNKWMEQHRGSKLKMPLSEGSVFISCYEGADTFTLGAATVAGDRTTVPVHLTYSEGGKTYHWTDVPVLHQVKGRWLLEDIYFSPAPAANRPVPAPPPDPSWTLRTRTSIPR